MQPKEIIGRFAQRIANRYTSEPQTVHSDKLGDFNLADPSDRKRLKKVVIDLQRESERLVENDISRWRDACRMARNWEDPNRQRLYDVYGDVEMDAHLSGTVGQINDYVKARSFKLEKPDGTDDGEASALFDAVWFKDLVNLMLEARYWGHSLIELGDVVVSPSGRMGFDGVTLIPRRHVVPEKGRITKTPGTDWRNGISYRERPFSDWLIEVGRQNDLGLYEKAALQTIPKKYALAFWDTFAEMFGMPIRIAHTSSRDEGERKKIAGMMRDMGANMWGLFGEDTQIDFVETAKTDSYNVYDRRVDRANSELSKLVLHQTMTIDDGSSLSQSQTHKDVLDNLVESICDQVRDVVNNQLLPLMVMHGFPVKDLSFEWDDPVDYTPEQQVAFETMVLNNYEVPGSYFEEKYGIPAGERKSIQLPSSSQQNGPAEGKNGKGEQKNSDEGFFD